MWFLIAVLCVSPIEVSDNYPEYNNELLEWAAQENVELLVRTSRNDLCKIKTTKIKTLGNFNGELFPRSGKMWLYEPEPVRVKMVNDCPQCRRVR